MALHNKQQVMEVSHYFWCINTEVIIMTTNNCTLTWLWSYHYLVVEIWHVQCYQSRIFRLKVPVSTIYGSTIALSYLWLFVHCNYCLAV